MTDNRSVANKVLSKRSSEVFNKLLMGDDYKTPQEIIADKQAKFWERAGFDQFYSIFMIFGMKGTKYSDVNAINNSVLGVYKKRYPRLR